MKRKPQQRDCTNDPPATAAELKVIRAYIYRTPAGVPEYVENMEGDREYLSPEDAAMFDPSKYHWRQ